MISIHQLLAGFTTGDAISQEARAIQATLRARGFTSEIYACPESIHIDLQETAHPLDKLTPGADDLVIYHHSIGSPAGELVGGLHCRRLMIYHNITPSSLIRSYNSKIAYQLDWGRDQLSSLRGSFELALAHSPFSEQELVQKGYRRTGCLPMLLHEKSYAIKPDRRLSRQLKDNLHNIVFVGRLAPNKAPHSLIKAFSIYQKFINSKSRLILVGSAGGFEAYEAQLREMVRRLDIAEAMFTGHVRQEQLLAFYRAADVFLCLSEHEGFCVPIVEAFKFGIPVVALSRAAVPDTVGEAGLLLEDPAPEIAAEAVEYLRSSLALRKLLVERGLRRYETHFSPGMVRAQLLSTVDRFLDHG